MVGLGISNQRETVVAWNRDAGEPFGPVHRVAVPTRPGKERKLAQRSYISHYRKIRSQLLKHADGFPYLRGLVSCGETWSARIRHGRRRQRSAVTWCTIVYKSVERKDPRLLYITIRGVNTLAVALWRVPDKLSSESVKAFVSTNGSIFYIANKASGSTYRN
jgi:hypothetical protein